MLVTRALSSQLQADARTGNRGTIWPRSVEADGLHVWVFSRGSLVWISHTAHKLIRAYISVWTRGDNWRTECEKLRATRHDRRVRLIYEYHWAQSLGCAVPETCACRIDRELFTEAMGEPLTMAILMRHIMSTKSVHDTARPTTTPGSSLNEYNGQPWSQTSEPKASRKSGPSWATAGATH